MNRFIGSLSILEELLSTPIIIPNYIIYTIVAIIFVEYMFYRVQTLNEYFEYNSFNKLIKQSQYWLEKTQIEMLEKTEHIVKRDEITDLRNQMASLLTEVYILQNQVMYDDVKRDEITDLRSKMASVLTDISLIQKDIQEYTDSSDRYNKTIKSSIELIANEIDEIEEKVDKNIKDYCTENILVITEYVEEKLIQIEEDVDKQIEEKLNSKKKITQQVKCLLPLKYGKEPRAQGSYEVKESRTRQEYALAK